MPPERQASPAALTAVPRRMRQACAVTAAVVIAFMAVVALLLRHSSTGVVSFGPADQFAMLGLGLAVGGGILFLARSRVEADATAVRVQNILGRYELPWGVVDAVLFDRDSPWATLRLVTGEEVAVLAVRAVDKERAVAAVEGLRRLHAAAHTVPDQRE